MTTPAPVKSSSTIVSGTSIDICDVPETKYESVLTMAEAFVRKNQFSGAAAAKPETSLISITLGQAFYNVIDARGYFARFKPGATMQPDVLHPNLAYGHLAAMSVNLENCPLYANGEIDGRADAEMYWAAFGAPVPPITEPTNSLIASDSDIDARPWISRLTGPGSFVGIYELARLPGGIPVDKKSTFGTRGLLVAYGSSLSNQFQNKTTLLSSQQKPTYGQFAIDPLQQRLRLKQRRNVRTVLHNAAVSVGFEPEVTNKRVEDTDAVRGPIQREALPLGMDARHALIAALQRRPQMVYPDIANDVDMMRFKNGEQHDGTASVPIVEYFDGVVPVSDALGGLVAFQDGNPGKGLYVLRDMSLCQSKFWDGGFTWCTQSQKEQQSKGGANRATDQWVLPEHLANACEYYTVKRLISE